MDLEKKLIKSLECRVKPWVNESLALKQAFHKNTTSTAIEYHEFARALEKFGLVPSPALRGLFDRYALVDTGGEQKLLSTEDFARGLLSNGPKPPILYALSFSNR